MKIAEEMVRGHDEGQELGLTDEEMAFYDALTKPQAIKDFYGNKELVAMTKELTETLRKNRTIDWHKKVGARAAMRVMIKRLLKKHKYPPDGMEDAIVTVMGQCEMWTDNEIM
jgi:type I restriction enzyme R subunit